MSWTTVEIAGKVCRVAVERTAEGVWIGWRGRTVFVPNERRDAARGLSEDEVRAPMTGKVVRVPAVAGMDVREGDVLVILEAMKMEYRLASPHDGRVDAVHCAEGELVDLGKTLVTLSDAPARPSGDGR